MNDEARVKQFIRKHPDCTLNTVSKKLDLSLLEALHHLANLEEKNQIICRQVEGDEPRFYVPIPHKTRLTPGSFFSRLGGRISSSFRGQL